MLGSGLFARCDAIQVPGTVLWCNFDLLRRFGFDVPRDNRITPRLHDQLTRAFSLRVLAAEEVTLEKRTTLFADRYGGEGVAPCKGSARGAFLPGVDLFLKGIGHTPLFVDNPNDFYHSHGGFHMWHGLYVAALKEVCANLFTAEPARIAALIDQGAVTTYPSGEILPRVIAVRAGNQLRPAHVLCRRRVGDRAQRSVLVSMAEATGQLVLRPGARGGAPRPDLAATMRRIIDDHARTAAEHARWRLSHGSVCPSNMQLDGGLLDLAQARTNPRCPPMAPEHGLDDEWIPRTDYMDRAASLAATYDMVLRTTEPDEQRRLHLVPLNVAEELDSAYDRHLTHALLGAAGFKGAAADRIQADSEEVATRYARSVIALTSLQNPGSKAKNMTYDARAAVVDVLGLLAAFPPVYFAHPEASHVRFVLARLAPVLEGSAQVIAENKRLLSKFSRELARAYHALMRAAAPLARDLYGSLDAMKVSIIERAAFENRPIDRLFYDARTAAFKSAAMAFHESPDSGAVRRLIGRTIAASLRNIDALLRSGERQRREDGAFELQIKVIDGVRYSVRASGKRRYVLVEVTAHLLEKQARAHLPGEPLLTPAQLRALSYHYTFDDWKSSHEVRGRVSHGDAQTVVRFTLPASVPYAVLEGEFRAPGVVLRDGPDPFAGYVVAIPDAQELASLF